MADSVKEILNFIRHEIAEIKRCHGAEFHPDYDKDGMMQAELEDDIAALQAEAAAMLKQMGVPPTHDVDSMTRMIGGPPYE